MRPVKIIVGCLTVALFFSCTQEKEDTYSWYNYKTNSFEVIEGFPEYPKDFIPDKSEARALYDILILRGRTPGEAMMVILSMTIKKQKENQRKVI